MKTKLNLDYKIAHHLQGKGERKVGMLCVFCHYYYFFFLKNRECKIKTATTTLNQQETMLLELKTTRIEQKSLVQ
jgi:hypothetical protein